MILPFVENAFIDSKKLIYYLLSNDHPDGRFKAKFFNQLGFSIQNSHEFQEAILIHANRNSIVCTQETQFGVKYIVEGVLPNPKNRDSRIRSVWIILNNESHPKFVTAYPAG